MVGNKYVFQMSGIKNLQQKRELLRGIRRLRGKYIGGSEYQEGMTHLIVTGPVASEKFIAACAGGKWIVTPEFVLDSVKQQAWLSEASYELNLSANLKALAITNPLQKWREKVARGFVCGAFQGWVVCLDIEDTRKRGMFKRILKAGKAVVCTDKSATQAVTHVFTKDGSKMSQNVRAPCHTISFIAYYLFGSLCSSLNWSINLHKPKFQENIVQEEATEESLGMEEESMDVMHNLLLFDLEEKLKDYIMKMELRKSKLLKVPELFNYYTPVFPTQVATVDFSNVRSLVECGLFPQAMEDVQCSLQPGVLPPASALHACMQHALHGEAQPYFLSMFSTVLNDVLRNNPTWRSPGSVKYFLQILQCPQCKNGVWPLLQTSVRFCLSSTATCHSLPSPAPSELLRFHGNLQAFFLRLFQLELRAASSRGGGLRMSVLYNMFWSMWEKSTLSSRALQQLAELLVEATLWGLHSTQEWKGRLLATLQEILAIVVEYWAQEHSKLNSRLVDKGFQDLAEYIAILCQDLHPDTLKELVPALPSPRLRMLTVDAIYRNICSRNGLFIHPEPLSLLKIVSSYLKALGQLCGCTLMHAHNRRAERSISTSSDSQVSNIGEKERVGGSGSGKENIPRGFHRVNPAGETLLHRACKRNQVETVLHILSLPGTDVNVKDHAGWTPLHEACNHGSSECVEVLLQNCPGLQLDSQVKGVSPLHDALLNQHTDIAKMLLRHAGSSLLLLRDDIGRTPLDLVSSALCEELQLCAQEADSALEVQCSEVRDLAFIEGCSCLLSCLLLSYLLEYHIPSYEAPDPPLELSPSIAEALITTSPETVASSWGDSGAVSLAEDLRTLMSMEQYVLQVNPALMHCQGPHTMMFVQLLKDLQADGVALLNGQPEL